MTGKNIDTVFDLGALVPDTLTTGVTPVVDPAPYAAERFSRGASWRVQEAKSNCSNISGVFTARQCAMSAASIGFDKESDFISEAGWLERQFGHRRFSFRTNSQTTQAAAARAGYGVAILPRFVAADDRGLVQVSLGERLPERDLWLLIRRDLTKVPRVRVVADYLIDIFRRERKLLAG